MTCACACMSACLPAWYFRMQHATVTATVGRGRPGRSDSRHLKYERDASAHDDECVHQVPDVAQVGPGVRDHAKVDYLRGSANRASKKPLYALCKTLFQEVMRISFTDCGHRMADRKWKEGKQQPSMLLGSAVPGSSLVSFYFLCAIPLYVRRL